MTDNNSLFLAVMIIGYVILGLLTIGVIIKIASVYARYKESKKGAAIELKDYKVLAIAQEQGETTILCKGVEDLPAEDTNVVVAPDGEEA